MLQLKFSKFKLEAGTDEAGRGCLAGPVVAAAVILPDDFKHPLLNDSKLLSEKQRLELRPFIEKNALAYAVCFVDAAKIDKINILQASILAMQKSILKLSVKPEFIIVDGNKFNPLKDIPHQTIIKGDSKFMSIAAASVLAKTYRDEFMEKIAKKFPDYAWHKNKGYPTKEHRSAIKNYGTTKYHRMSFKLLPIQLEIEFP
ncbi:MAG TPA: ribonuclease HII [Flavobacteriia bacterium]|nr:ribonuclease HII [Flavobacteriia bacterium]